MGIIYKNIMKWCIGIICFKVKMFYIVMFIYTVENLFLYIKLYVFFHSNCKYCWITKWSRYLKLEHAHCDIMTLLLVRRGMFSRRCMSSNIWSGDLALYKAYWAVRFLQFRIRWSNLPSYKRKLFQNFNNLTPIKKHLIK